MSYTNCRNDRRTLRVMACPGHLRLACDKEEKNVDARPKATSVRHGLCLKRCTALILLDSRRFRISWTRERTKAVRCQNIVFHGILKHVPWAVVDRLEEQHETDRDPRALEAKPHLIAMLCAQLFGLRSLRDIETNLRSHAGKGARPFRSRHSRRPMRRVLLKSLQGCFLH